MRQVSDLQVTTHHGMARVTLNRPERRNAYDGRLISDVHDAFEKIAQDASIRVVVLTGAGAAFCAGADLRWMAPDTPVSDAQVRKDAERLSVMYRAIDECPCPVIGRVNGPAFGGGVGLVAVCDIVVAAEDAIFALSETRVGLVPAVISPFLLRKTGESFLRRYCLTGETFSASTARQFNLVHEIVERGNLDARVSELIEGVRHGAPQAARNTKALLRRLLALPEPNRLPVSVEANAQARLSAEAKEGIRAFVSKHPPAWALQKQVR
ncbi:MAG TPA: enoyl-CoA hydratase-related protein [Nitrospiraceae bacterium]|nr:enoyl-CoA hydratase-related protein [Nitrospiraceae bacterium]